ncbi:hypothetical protein SprV_0200744000 [Sparganum proliferum]
MQISAAAAVSQRQRLTVSNVPVMSTDIPGADWIVGHLRANCRTRNASNVISPSTSPLPPTPSTYADRPSELPLTSSSSSSSTTTTSSSFFFFSPYSSTASSSAVVTTAMPINTTHNFDTPKNTTTVKASDECLVYTSPHCDHTFNSHTGLVGH